LNLLLFNRMFYTLNDINISVFYVEGINTALSLINILLQVYN